MRKYMSYVIKLKLFLLIRDILEIVILETLMVVKIIEICFVDFFIFSVTLAKLN